MSSKTGTAPTSFIHYGKGGELTTNRLDDQEISMLSLHLLQISLAYINTLDAATDPGGKRVDGATDAQRIIED